MWKVLERWKCSNGGIVVVRQEAREEIKFVYAKAKGGITQEREQTERLAWMLGCGGEKRHCNVY